MQIKGNETKGKREDGSVVSVYFDSATELLKDLNKISPAMCLAKWYNVSIHLTTGRTHSCYHPPSHAIPLEELNKSPGALHNTNYKKAQRTMMLKGERPKECGYCWRIEDADGGNQHLSDRAYRSFDVYEPGMLEEVQKLGAGGDPTPRYVEVNFNQSCNLKCTYCSPHLSSTWKREIDEHGPIQLLEHRHNDLQGLEEGGLMPRLERMKQYVGAFWDWWPTLYPKLKYFRMTGGEPLIDKNTFRVFDYVVQNPRPDLNLSITSNCCPPPEIWDRFMKSVKMMAKGHAVDHFTLFCSLDTFGEQAEYIRTGLDFSLLEKNLHQFLSETERTSVTFIVTFNIMSVPNFLKFLEWVLALNRKYSTDRRKIWFDTPILNDPHWQNVQILPERYRELVQDCIAFMEKYNTTDSNVFSEFRDFEIARLKRLYAFMCQSPDPAVVQKSRANFKLYFEEMDRRRGTSYRSTFPQMADFFDLCDLALVDCQKKKISATLEVAT